MSTIVLYRATGYKRLIVEEIANKLFLESQYGNPIYEVKVGFLGCLDDIQWLWKYKNEIHGFSCIHENLEGRISEFVFDTPANVERKQSGTHNDFWINFSFFYVKLMGVESNWKKVGF